MPSFGDLLAAIYEHRVLVGVVSAIAVVAVAPRRLAGRADRGARAAGRASTVAIVVAALVVGLPIAWYLASPLFIRTELVEPPVVAAVDLTPAPTARALRPHALRHDAGPAPSPGHADARPADARAPRRPAIR